MSGPAPVTLVPALVLPLLVPIDYAPGARSALPPISPFFLRPLLGAAFGQGSIYGTTAKLETGAPSAVPVSRRVILLLEPSLQFIAETWSAAGTGAYRFDGLSTNARFTVVSYDHLRDKRAVIADNLLPEVLP